MTVSGHGMLLVWNHGILWNLVLKHRRSSTSRNRAKLWMPKRPCQESPSQIFASCHFKNLNLLTSIDIYWHLLTSVDIYWHLLTSIDINWHQLTSIDIYWHLLNSIDIYWHLLTSINIYWHLLTSINPKNTWQKETDLIFQAGDLWTTRCFSCFFWWIVHLRHEKTRLLHHQPDALCVCF